MEWKDWRVDERVGNLWEKTCNAFRGNVKEGKKNQRNGREREKRVRQQEKRQRFISYDRGPQIHICICSIYIYIYKLWFMKWWPLGGKKRALSISCLTVFLCYFCFCVLVLYVVWQNAVGVGFKEQVVDSNSMYRGITRERWRN